MTNRYGLIHDNLTIKDWIFGGNGSAPYEERTDNWKDYLPVKEYQKKLFDTMGCVTFSALNVLESVFNYAIREDEIPFEDFEWLRDNGYISGGKVNFSDRYIAKLSGTSKSGNTYRNVGDAIRKFGLVPEVLWSFTKSQSWIDYYAEVPAHIKDLGQEFNNRFEIYYEYIQDKDIGSALKSSPLQVGVYAWTEHTKSGIYSQRKLNANHAITLYQIDKYPNCYDHYENVYKKFVPYYNWGGVMRYDIKFINKDYSMDQLKNNTLVQETQVGGAFGLYLDGRIYVGDLSEILATWEMRNEGKTDGMTKAVLKKQ